MSSPIPIYWWAYAVCDAPDLDALADACVGYIQWEGETTDGYGIVSVRFLSGSPTMRGVKMDGYSAVKRAFRGLIAVEDVYQLLREADGAIFDTEAIA